MLRNVSFDCAYSEMLWEIWNRLEHGEMIMWSPSFVYH
jgi:hypothetical protein